jgi:hypothetical protein
MRGTIRDTKRETIRGTHRDHQRHSKTIRVLGDHARTIASSANSATKP